jgi:hypothetical protein
MYSSVGLAESNFVEIFPVYSRISYDEIKEDQMGGASSTHGKEEKFIQGISDSI